MKAVRDRSEEFCDPARKEDISGRTKTRLELWEEHLKDPMAALAKALECLENPTRVGIWFHSLSLPACVVAVASSLVGARIFSKDVARAHLGRRLAFCGPTGCCGFAHNVWRLERKRKYGPDGERCFFLIKRESFALAKAVEFKPFCARGGAQGMYFGCSTPDGSRR